MNRIVRMNIVFIVVLAITSSVLIQPALMGPRERRPSSPSAQTVVFGPEIYTRGTGEPQPSTKTFSIANNQQEFTLVVQNPRLGEKLGNVVINVNGIAVVHHPDSNKKVTKLAVAIQLQRQNTISVTLRGAPATAVTVSIIEGHLPPASPIITLPSNASDPLILQAETSNGEVIEYFGERDDKGFAESLYGVRVQSARGDITTFSLDDEGRISQINAPNGVVFRISWTSETSIVITLIAEDGSVHLDVPVDLAELSTTSNPLTLGTNVTKALSSSQKDPVVTIQAAAPSSSLISVNRCGVAINNANVRLEVRNQLSDPLSLQAKLVGSGLYSVSIPTIESTPIRRGREACERAAQRVGLGCDALKLLGPAFTFGICPLISVFLAGIPGGALVVPAFFVACEAAAAAATLYCSTLGYSPEIGAPSVGEFVCKSIANIANRAVQTTSLFFVSVTIPGVPGEITDVKSAPARGPFPNFTIEVPCPAQCQGGLGGRIFSTGGQTQVTILPAEADFTNEIYLLSPGAPRFLGTNRNAGAVINLGSFPVAAELVFGIRVRDTQQTFKTGPGSRNPDGIPHAIVQCLTDGSIRVGFEDKINSDDIDHDDAVIRVRTIP